MKWMIPLALCAGAAQADVLGLNDYDAIFAEKADVITILDDGAEAIQMPGDVQVLRDGDRITTLDQGAGGAVGCFVRVLAQLDAYQAACDAPFDADQMALHGAYLDQVLGFYVKNSQPVATDAQGRAGYDALVESAAISASAYCAPGTKVRSFLTSVVTPRTQAVVDALTATPRLPADNPCF